VFELVRADLRRALEDNQHSVSLKALILELCYPGTQAILVYRFASWVDRIRFALFRYPLKVFVFIIRYYFHWRVGVFIPTSAKIGPGMCIHGFLGGILIANTTIGRNFTIIGGGIQMDYEVREIGDDVNLAPGTKINGKIRIGHRARTGPNCVVQRDIPDDCVAFGNPARIIGPVRKLTYEEGSRRIVPKTMRDTPASPTPSGDDS
jgi:serine O-acetyltransferase